MMEMPVTGAQQVAQRREIIHKKAFVLCLLDIGAKTHFQTIQNIGGHVVGVRPGPFGQLPCNLAHQLRPAHGCFQKLLFRDGIADHILSLIHIFYYFHSYYLVAEKDGVEYVLPGCGRTDDTGYQDYGHLFDEPMTLEKFFERIKKYWAQDGAESLSGGWGFDEGLS